MYRTLRIVPALIFPAVLFVAAVALFGADKRSHVLTGRVVDITDGDTITVRDAKKREHKVRLLGIDAPEVGHGKGQPDQPFGTKAKEYLGALVGEKDVQVFWYERDRNKHVLGEVYAEGGWINREMIRAGLAWHSSDDEKGKVLAKIEQHARDEKRGLWADEDQTPPWEWRKEARQAKNSR